MISYAFGVFSTVLASMCGVMFDYFFVVFVAKLQFIAPMVAKCYTIWSCSSLGKQHERAYKLAKRYLYNGLGHPGSRMQEFMGLLKGVPEDSDSGNVDFVFTL